jgi:hypothetical protein
VTPEISEFSYGFALTNEIVGWAPLGAAPIFPSLIEEGRAGGGYDVKLDMPSVPLYLQFKRADCMITRKAREVSLYGLPLRVPFHRFWITGAGRSDQHELLLALDDGSCLVYYAAPRFHELAEINDAWTNYAVADRSIFIAPSTIGPLDDDWHHVSYDDMDAWVCSEPREISFLSSGELMQKLVAKIDSDPRPLREKLPELVHRLHAAERRAEERIAERGGTEGFLDRLGLAREGREELRSGRVPVRTPRDLTESERQLRDAADLAGRVFDAQLIIVQRNS